MQRIWRHSPADAALLALTVAQAVAVVLWATSFATLPWWINLALFAAITFFHFHNTIVATHSFLHCPFFMRNWQNRAFSIVNSTNLFVPTVLYKFHHILHHRYNNDPMRDGTTLDPSSTYRHGKDGKHEHVVPYVLSGLFRGTNFAYDEVKKRGELPQLHRELVAMAAFTALLLAIDWRFFAFAFLPMVYASWCLTHVENYYDHYRCADPDSRYANSVSYYGKLFNLLYFNEGYHQEHHVSPSCHWTKRPALVKELHEKITQTGNKPARYPSLLGFLE